MNNMLAEKYNQKKEGAIRSFDFKSHKVKLLYLIIGGLCVATAVCMLFPVVWVFLSGFKEIKELNSSTSLWPEKIDLKLLGEAWNGMSFMKYYINSLIVVVGSVVCSVFVNGLTAYGLAILKPKGSKIVSALIFLCLMIPSTGSIVALYVNICKLGLSNSFVPLWLSAGASAFYVILFMNFFNSLPKDYLEAARLDGAGNFRLFIRIVMPLAKPIAMVVVIFTISNAWSDFLLPYLLLNHSGKETVMVKLYLLESLDATTSVMMIRAILFSIIPPTIFFLIFQKKITDGAVGAGGIKG